VKARGWRVGGGGFELRWQGFQLDSLLCLLVFSGFLLGPRDKFPDVGICES
jgi:hypothetical protein